MTSSGALHQARHSVSRLHVHLAFVTKYRCRIFNAAVLEAMKGIFTDTCQRLGAYMNIDELDALVLESAE